MRLETLVAKLELQEEREWEKQWAKQRQEALHPRITQEAKDEQSISMICRLQKKTADVYYQLELNRRLQAEQEHFLRASMQLREANLTTAERKARENEAHRGQILFSKVCPELHPDWRQHAQEEFLAKKL
jgi:hypothetical protein